MKHKLSNISSLQIFQFLRFSTLILIGVVFTKTTLTTNQIGEYEYFLFLSGAVSFFWLNGLIRGLLPLDKEKSHRNFFSAFLVVTSFTVLAMLVLLLVNQYGKGTLLQKDEIPYLQLLLAYLFFGVPSGLIEYFFLIRNEPKKIVRYGLVSFGLMFLLVATPAVLGMPLINSLYGLVAVAFLRYGYLIFLIARYSGFNFSVDFVKEHLGLALPLVLSALLSGSAQYVDGFIVTSKFDEASFAIFRFGARELPLVLLLANAFSTAMLPEFSEKGQLASTLNKIKTESLKMANYLFPLTAILLALSHFLFPLVFNSNFKESASIFNVYLLLIISRLVFPQTILIGLKKTKIIAVASFFELILNVAFSLWFVQVWGIVGIAYATVLAYIFEKLILIVGVRKLFSIELIKYQKISIHMVYSVLLLLIFYVIEFLIY